MMTNPPLPLLNNHQIDNTSREHPIKDAKTNTNKTRIIHDPNVTIHLEHITNGVQEMYY